MSDMWSSLISLMERKPEAVRKAVDADIAKTKAEKEKVVK